MISGSKRQEPQLAPVRSDGGVQTEQTSKLEKAFSAKGAVELKRQGRAKYRLAGEGRFPLIDSALSSLAPSISSE